MGSPITRVRLARLTIAGLALGLVGVSHAFAQASRVALDTVAAIDGDVGSQVSRKPTAWFDVFAAVRLFDGLDLRVRPVVFRKSFDGSWQTQMYELALRYERPGRVGVRVEFGQFTSPIGLSIQENRPDQNPVISQHSTLYLPVPRFEPGSPTTYLLAASYPFGTQITLSSATWDARVAFTDSSPVRGRPFFGDHKPPRLLNTVVGGGVTPRTGLRVGAAFAAGPWASATEVRDKSKGDRQATMAQVEGEWSFGHTRLGGEWIWTWRETAVDDYARVHGGWIELMQTLAPRWFMAVRYDDQATWWESQASGAYRMEGYRRVETGVGYRLTRDVTLRGSYLTRKGYVVSFWDDQVLGSLVFSRRIK